MIEFERVTFRGVNKDISPKALDAGGNRVAVNPLIEAENCRFTVGEDGTFEAVQNLRSNFLYDNALPAGENSVIGSYFDKWNNQFIYFNYNSNGFHGIYSKKSDDTTLGFKLLVGSPSMGGEVVTTLGFTKDKFVHSVVVIDKLLFWEYDGTARSVKFILDTEKEFDVKGIKKSIRETSLLKPPPFNALEPFRHLINPGAVNRIYKNNYQFAKRVVYYDNTVSELSCFSYYTIATYNGSEASTINGSIFVNVSSPNLIDSDLVNSVKELQILFRRNNNDTWKIFLKQPGYFNSVATPFTDSSSYEEVPSNETYQIFDSVPVKIGSIASIKNRLFITANEEGFDNDGSALLSASIVVDSTIPTTSKQHEGLFFKAGGLYQFGLIHYDEFLRTDGVSSVVDVSIPRPTVGNGTTISSGTGQKRKIICNISGTPPTWAKYYSIARTENKNQVVYLQIPARILFYLGEYQEGIAIPSGYRKMDNGKIYKDVNPTAASEFNYIHFQLPENLPYTPDVGDTVKILNSFGVSYESQVLDFDGRMLTCDKFSINNWSNVGGSSNICLIEIYKKSEVSNEVFYEVSSLKSLYNSAGIYTGYSQVPIIGDTYSLNDVFKFVNLKGNATNDMSSYVPFYPQFSATIESPTSTRANIGNVVVTPTTASSSDTKLMEIKRQKALFDGDPKTSAIDIQNKFKLKSYQGNSGTTNTEGVPDYTKINSQLGRPLLADKFNKVYRQNTIRYSNTYVEDSNLNGLSKFNPLNQYTLSGDRTPIRRLIAVDNVLLAVHEQNITSMYVGEGFIRQADGTETLTVTESVIGQDRILSGGYGSKNPESITSHMGMCFGWDVTKGVVWRYTNAGVYPISDYGMKDYFLRLSRKIAFYEGYDWGSAPKGVIKVITAIDEYNKEMLITFKRVQGEDISTTSSITWTSADDQTWAFNYERNIWFPKMPFVPEAYAFNGQLLFSFLNGQMWGHNMGREKDYLGNGNPYNNFYGVQYSRKLRFYMNSQAYKSKVALSLQIAQENLGDENDSLNVVEVSGYSEYDIVGTTDQQETEMKVADFDKVENVYYGPVLKDKNSLVEAGQDPLLHGDDMRDQVFDVTIYNRTNKPAKLYYVNFGYIFSEYGN